MSDSLDTIAGFLLRFRDEVEGRGPVDPPPPEMRAELEALAAGALDRERQLELVGQLRRQPSWVAYLAGIIRNRAPDSIGDGSQTS